MSDTEHSDELPELPTCQCPMCDEKALEPNRFCLECLENDCTALVSHCTDLGFSNLDTVDYHNLLRSENSDGSDQDYIVR